MNSEGINRNPWDPPSPAAFARCFRMSALALLFTFDLNVKGLDLLPDVVTYAVVFFALDGIRGRHRLVGVTRGLAITLAVVSLLDFFRDSPLSTSVAGPALVLVHLVFVWLLFQIVVDALAHYQRSREARTAGAARLAYTIFWGTFLVMGVGVEALGGTDPTASSQLGALLLLAVGFLVVGGLCYAMWIASQALERGRRPRFVYPVMQGRPPS